MRWNVQPPVLSDHASSLPPSSHLYIKPLSTSPDKFAIGRVLTVIPSPLLFVPIHSSVMWMPLLHQLLHSSSTKVPVCFSIFGPFSRSTHGLSFFSHLRPFNFLHIFYNIGLLNIYCKFLPKQICRPSMVEISL